VKAIKKIRTYTDEPSRPSPVIGIWNEPEGSTDLESLFATLTKTSPRPRREDSVRQDRSVPVSSDFTGTNTDKIDKLVANVIELRVTLRICLTVIGVGFPIMMGLLTFLVVQSFNNSAKVDRLTEQIAAVRSDYSRLADRLEKLERPSRP
jgi:hypothetical protein